MGKIPPTRRLAVALGAALVIALLAAGVVWRAALDRALTQAEETGAAQLTLAAKGLEQDLVRFKLQAKTLAETYDPALSAAAQADLAARAAAISGARSVRFLPWGAPGDPELDRAVRRAYQGAIGFDYTGGAFVIAAPIRRAGAVAGAVVATVEAAELEWAWRALPEDLFFYR